MMNNVNLIGRLTADLELKQTANGTMIARFTVAINRPVKQGQEKQADFISCTAFNKTAEFVSRYFHKGDYIGVTGSIRTGSYNDKRYPDVKHYTSDVWVEKCCFCGYSQTAQNTPAYAAANNNSAHETANGAAFNPSDFEDIISDDTDLPF